MEKRSERKNGGKGRGKSATGKSAPKKDAPKKDTKKFWPKSDGPKTSRTGRVLKGRAAHKEPALPTFSEYVRLNKYIANAGVCSRREADVLIQAGVVEVNGQVITEMGHKVGPGDIVKYGGSTLKQEKLRYLVLNKPKDYITTSSDPENRRTVIHLVKNACKERIFSVGRLDRNTTGLLLFTNDGDLAKKLTHPKFNVKKLYHITLDRPVRFEHLEALREGITLHDGLIKADHVEYVSTADDKREVGIEIHSGRNRIVRRMFEFFDYKVMKLDRVVFAGLTKKDLPRGKWRFLTDQEVAFLKMNK
jgi:23S rRNA pseudouridine2605 synthase